MFSLAKRAFEIAKKAKEFIFRKMEIRGDELKWPLNPNIGGEAVKIEEIKKVISNYKKELKEKYKVKEIGIFGSYVRGEQQEISDIDILVEFEEPIGWEIVDLHEYLEEVLGVKVDLVTKGAVMRKPLLWQSIKEDLINV